MKKDSVNDFRPPKGGEHQEGRKRKTEGEGGGLYRRDPVSDMTEQLLSEQYSQGQSHRKSKR